MNKESNVLTPSLEDYLEAIFVINLRAKVVRVKDIIKSLNVKSSSVVAALKTLADKEFVVHERYGYIELTQKGIKTAEEVYKKHNILLKFIHEILGVDFDIAVKDACQIEHYINEATLKKIIKFIEFIETCPQEEPNDLLSSFHYFVKHDKRPKCRVHNVKA